MGEEEPEKDENDEEMDEEEPEETEEEKQARFNIAAKVIRGAPLHRLQYYVSCAFIHSRRSLLLAIRVAIILLARPTLLCLLMPSSTALQEGRWEECAELLAEDVSPTAADEQGWTSLHWACCLGFDGDPPSSLQTPPKITRGASVACKK
jgi:hypothetical protein